MGIQAMDVEVYRERVKELAIKGEKELGLLSTALSIEYAQSLINQRSHNENTKKGRKENE